MSFEAAYRRAIAEQGLEADSAQLEVLDRLVAIASALAEPVPGRGLFRRSAPVLVRGMYLWGGVGRGKTWLIDLFLKELPDGGWRRMHFHRFMQDVHQRMRELGRKPNPLQHVAADMARQARLLFLDEFAVNDIGDAVILAGLLRGLFEQGVTLLATSNQQPDDLYKDGIQRASFLPAINLLKTHTHVVRMGGDRDYRLAALIEGGRTWFSPAGANADELIMSEFRQLAAGVTESDGDYPVLGRIIPYRHRAAGMIWCDFEALCGPPRSQHDYIELARLHHTVILTDIPQLGAAREDRSRRFIFLIDEFYDRKIKFLLSTDVGIPERLYSGERLAFEFQRTASRLREMQTETYLSQPHRA